MALANTKIKIIEDADATGEVAEALRLLACQLWPQANPPEFSNR